MITAGRRSQPPVTGPGHVLAAAVTALLGPERATPEQVRAAAAEGIRILAKGRATVMDLLGQPTLAPTSPL